MRKMIFTLALTIVSSVWMMSKAQCLVPSTEQEGPYVEELTGLLCLDAYPCPYNENCPACLTVVLRSKEKKYYLTGPVAESIDVPTDGQYVKVVVSGITGNTELGNNEYYNWLTVEKWSYSEEPVTTNIQTYGYVEDESGTRLEGIGVIVHTTDWTVSDTVYSQAQGMFISSIKGIAYPVNSMEVTVSDITGKFKEQTKSTTYTYECGVDFNPETNTASNSEELLFVLQENKIRTTLPSLCDEWNVLEISNVTCGYCEEYRTYNFHLTTDTVIGGLLYSQLIKDGAYKGALREGNNRDIYCVPAGCSQEYLLYAFNAQVGDSLKNIWVGGYSSWIPDVRSAIVSEIKQTTPRTIELEVHYYEAPDAYEESIRNLTWIEGIGMPVGPMGAECSVFNGCADSKAKLLLCSYKNGEQVYVSEMGEQYGCVYNYDPYAAPSDTIPLYTFTGDDPGSSTVDPVDPNQVVVTLKGDELTIKESSGETILYRLTNTSSDAASAPYRVPQAQTPQSFQNEINITLTEEGTYSLILTNPDWGYGIYGTFSYPNRKDAIDNTPSPSKENQGKVSKLILSDGQILILRGEKIYTIQGQRVK